MSTLRDHFEAHLGKDLRDLIPLIEAALVVLDKPGTRALRSKIDKGFHCVVWGYGTVRRCGMDEGEWDALRPTLPHYKRATDLWPAQKSYDARKAGEASADAEVQAVQALDTSAPRGLRVVVDNTLAMPRRSPSIDLPQGGAA